MPDGARPQRVFFALDNVQVDFASASGGQDFLYQPNPRLAPLSRDGPTRPYRLKPGHVLDVEVSTCQPGTRPGYLGLGGAVGGIGPAEAAPAVCSRGRASTLA